MLQQNLHQDNISHHIGSDDYQNQTEIVHVVKTIENCQRNTRIKNKSGYEYYYNIIAKLIALPQFQLRALK